MNKKFITISAILLAGCNIIRANLNLSVQHSLEVQSMQDATDRRRQIAQEYFDQQQAKKLFGENKHDIEQRKRDAFAIKIAKAQWQKTKDN